MTLTNFIIGWYIVEDEQEEEKKAGYAKETIAFLSKELTKDFGKGYSARNLALMKKFYITYSQRIQSNSILQTVSAKSSSGKTMHELPFTLS